MGSLAVELLLHVGEGCPNFAQADQAHTWTVSDFGSGLISAMNAAKSVWLCTSYCAKSTCVALFKYANVCGPSHASNDLPAHGFHH